MGTEQSKASSPESHVDFTPKLSDKNYGRQYCSHGYYGEADERMAFQSLMDLLSTSAGGTTVGDPSARTPPSSLHATPSDPTLLSPSPPSTRAIHATKLAGENASEQRGKRSKRKCIDARVDSPAPVRLPSPSPPAVSSSEAHPPPLSAEERSVMELSPPTAVSGGGGPAMSITGPPPNVPSSSSEVPSPPPSLLMPCEVKTQTIRPVQQPSQSVEQVLDELRPRFIKEMDAKVIAYNLQHLGIISDGDLKTVKQENDREQQSMFLFHHVRKKCDESALMAFCDQVISVEGNPLMKAFGKDMKSMLEDKTRQKPVSDKASLSTFDKLKAYYLATPTIQKSFLLGPAKQLGQRAMECVKLNLIQPRQQIPVAGQDGAFPSVTLCKGGVSEVPHQKVPLEYEDIFNFQPHDNGTRRHVLIEGVPGCGKTTLIKRMCRDWANGSFAKDSKAVIQVVLRGLPKRDELTIEDMVHTLARDKKVAADIAQCVRDCQGDGVTFVLDGFDEISEEMRQSIVRDIHEGHLAPKASFLVTSRPISAQSLYQVVDRRIEVTGFGEPEVEKYVTDYFAISDVAAGKKLLSSLDSRPTIRSLCYVPLQLLMVCFTASYEKDLPRTMNELFERIVILTVNRHMEKAGGEERAKSLKDVIRLCPSFVKFAQLALEGLKTDTLVFSDVHFKVDEALLGLVNCIEIPDEFGGTTRTWHFLHLTLQEYFAAYALSVAPEAEQMEFWSKRLLFKCHTRQITVIKSLRQYILSEDRFRTMFLLFCGITGLRSKTGVQAMLIEAADAVFEPRIEDGSALPALCEAVSESGNKELACRIMSTCGSNDVHVSLMYSTLPGPGVPWCIETYGEHTEDLQLFISGDSDHPYHLYLSPSRVVQFLGQLKSLVTLTGLELSLMRPEGEQDLLHLKTIAQFLMRQKTLKHLTLSVRSPITMMLQHDYCCSFTKDEGSCFWEVLKHHCGSLQSIGLKVCARCEVSQSDVINILNTLPNLTALNFDEIALPDNEAEDELVIGTISFAVYQHQSLNELTASDRCSPSLVNGAVEGIVRKEGVKKLVVESDFPDHLVPEVVCALKKQSVEVLGLQLSVMSPSTVELFRALPPSQLREFGFTLTDKDELTVSSTAALCRDMKKGISGCSTLMKLSVKDKPTLLPSLGGKYVERGISACSMQAAMALQSSLTEVEWRRCNFSCTGLLLNTFAVHLKHSRLRKVTFDGCYLTSVDVAVLLSEGLSKNSTLEQLHIRWCKPEDVDDATLLGKVETSIASNHSLQMLRVELIPDSIVEAILKGACRNISLKELDIKAPYGQMHIMGACTAAAAAELRRVRPQMKFLLC